jgi:hypothetical protein
MRLAAPAVALAAAWVLLFLDIDPVPTWFYVFAWYPTLALLDAAATRLDGRPSAPTCCCLTPAGNAGSASYSRLPR